MITSIYKHYRFNRITFILIVIVMSVVVCWAQSNNVLNTGSEKPTAEMIERQKKIDRMIEKWQTIFEGVDFSEKELFDVI